MVDWLKRIDQFFGKENRLWTFCKAQFSAQIATVADFVMTILLVKLFDVFYLYATFLGAVLGGVINCMINYRWTFQADDCKRSHVALKYIPVWLTSILLNTWGTYALTEFIIEAKLMDRLLGFYISDVFIFSKFIVAVLVAFFWNYQLQRVFVYRNHNMKNFFKQHKEKDYEL